MWLLRYDDGDNGKITRQHETEEDAFIAASALFQRYLDLSIEAPDGTLYYEVAFVDWCSKHWSRKPALS